jgi:hypothetical protein
MRYMPICCFLISACAGQLNQQNVPVAHCVALDIESDWGPPLAAGLGATGLGLSSYAAAEKSPTKSVQITAIVLGGAALVAGGVGTYASKSWHEICAAPATKEPKP